MHMSKTLQGRQKFLDEPLSGERRRVSSEITRLLNWNVRNPSLRRATTQTDWLEKGGFDAIVLTEVKLSRGCSYIEDRLKSLGYNVIFPMLKDEDYGVILGASGFSKEIPDIQTGFLGYRTCSIVYGFHGKSILITGVYVPVWRNPEKKKFLDELERLMADEHLKRRFDGWVILGDLNVLEPNHVPSYVQYKEWEYFYDAFSRYGFVDAFRFFRPEEKEYSWFGRDENGYRFDHAFVSKDIVPLLKDCYYVHEPRVEKLSDHSAMVLELKPP